MTLRMRPFVQLCSAIFLLAVVSDAQALDKQGSAHGGQLEGATEGFDVEGALVLGIALYNPSYAARPANTGLALFRYAMHADFDLIGRRLSIPLDLNMFTDGSRSGLRKLIPSEGDVITGVTSTWRVGPGALESGLRVEHDRTLDSTAEERKLVPDNQTYVDARVRYLYSLADTWPALGDRLWDGDVSGWLTLGWFAFNPTYAARPDNSGLALFRYGAHTASRSTRRVGKAFCSTRRGYHPIMGREGPSGDLAEKTNAVVAEAIAPQPTATRTASASCRCGKTTCPSVSMARYLRTAARTIQWRRRSSISRLRSSVAFRPSRFISRTSGTCPSIEAVWSSSSFTRCSCTNSISCTTTPVHLRIAGKWCRREAKPLGFAAS